MSDRAYFRQIDRLREYKRKINALKKQIAVEKQRADTLKKERNGARAVIITLSNILDQFGLYDPEKRLKGIKEIADDYIHFINQSEKGKRS